MSQAPYGPTPTTPPPWPPQAAPRQGRTNLRLLPILSAALGLLGLIVGVAAWFRAAPSNVGANSAYTEQEANDAKKAVCDAYAKGVRSFRIAANRKVDNPADKLPVAVNTRVAEVAVGNYLNNALDSNPATPPELQSSIRQLAQAYQDIALTQLAEGTTPDVEPFGQSADEAIAKTNQICQ